MITRRSFVRETTTTSGTGTYSLGGATDKFRTFVAANGSGAKVYYSVFSDSDFEIGIGTVTAGAPDTLSRDTILESSNADAAVNWPASGQRTVIQVLAAKKVIEEDENGDISVTRDIVIGRNVEGALSVNGGGTFADQVTINLPSAGPPIALDAEGQGQKVTGLNADQVDGAHVGTSNGNIVLRENIASAMDAATTSAKGAVELATQAEVDAESDATRALTPATLGGWTMSQTFKDANKIGGTVLVQEVTASSSPELILGNSGQISSTYDHYIIEIIGIVPGTDQVELRMQTSSDGGSTFDSGASDYWTRTDGAAGGVSIGENLQTTHALLVDTGGLLSTDAGHSLSATLKLTSHANSSLYTMFAADIHWMDHGTRLAVLSGTIIRQSAGVVDAVRLFTSSGNIASGKIKLYGVL